MITYFLIKKKTGKITLISEEKPVGFNNDIFELKKIDMDGSDKNKLDLGYRVEFKNNSYTIEEPLMKKDASQEELISKINGCKDINDLKNLIKKHLI